MVRQRILVTGAAGNLGQDLLSRLKLFHYIESVGTTSDQLNLAWKKERIHEVLDSIKPDIIINTAAFTQVDAAESDFDMAMKVNGAGPEALAEWVNRNNSYLIHISTDYLFDGTKGSLYNPDDTPNPVNRYGISKLAGETSVLLTAPQRAVIVRTSWLFGSGGKNFVPFIIRSAQSQTPVQIVTDQWGTPTWTGSLSKMLLDIMEERPTWILHGCCKGMTTRYEQARFICLSLGLSSEFITPVTSESLNLPAKRPYNSAMNSSFDTVLDWKEATQRFLLSHGFLKTNVV